MRIAMVAACPFPANHGSPASIREMSEALSDRGHEIHVLTYPNGDDIPIAGPTVHRVRVGRRSEQATVKVGPAWEKFLFDPLMVVSLIRIIRREKIDVIHAHNYEAALIGWMAKVVTGVPMLYNAVNLMADELHTYDFFRSKRLARRLGGWLDRHIPRRGDAVTTVSAHLRDRLVESGVDPKKVRVLPAGVNPEMFSDIEAGSLRQDLGICDDAPVIVYTGTLHQFQRVDYLLSALTHLIADRPEVQVVVACNLSEPIVTERFRNLVREWHLQDHVILCEDVTLEKMPAYLALADVAALPRPACLGHPVKALNYMAAGCAIAGFQNSANGLQDGVNALLAPDYDIRGFTECIRKLIDEPALRRQLGKEARVTVEKNYSWRRLAARVEEIYEDMTREIR